MDEGRLRRALDDADYRVLLMVVFHLSGDRRWLEPPYRPKRDVRLIAAEDAGLPEAVRAEIRDAACALLTSDTGPAVGDPGDERMVEMMSACLGERVPPEYAEMMREEIGFVSRDCRWSNDTAPSPAGRRRVLIVGAGASGIILGARLERLGIPYLIVERNADVGGTWWENRYPGCGVDTPNHAYSFSIGKRYRWERYFSPQRQLSDYMQQASEEFGVRPHIRFQTRVVAADWDDAKASWRVRVESPDGPEEIEAAFLVSAIGQFGKPREVHFRGMEQFRGSLFHSSAWPEELDLDGKRVAIVGTGASSMQIAPTIADRVDSLTIYQRSPQWARPIPRYHEPISDDAQWLLSEVPLYAAWFRFTMLWRYGDGLLRWLRKDPDWHDPERSLNRINDRHRQEMTDHIIAALGDRTDLHDACIPTYPPYGKRILLDNGWYEMLRRENVELVTDAIGSLDGTGIRTEDGTHRPADVVVVATGFEMTEMTARLNVRGRGGLDLRDAWAEENPKAYLGITVPRFPNLFLMQGPNTGLGHGGSAIFTAECQARYISGMLVRMIEEQIAAIDVRPEEQDAWVERVDAEHEQLIWTHPGMSTYYRNQHGRVMSVIPFRLVDYWRMTHDPTLDEYVTTPAG